MTQSTQQKVTIFYHAPCLDGCTAAWVAYKKWGDDAQYIGINHDSIEATKKLIFDYIDEDTYAVFVDYTPPRKLMDEIADKAESVKIYDHHASAIRDMQGYEHKKVKLVFDQDHSGAAIIHDDLFKRKRPLIVELAQMVDLERTTHKDFFPIAAYLDSLPISDINEAYESLEMVNDLSLNEIIKRGQPIRRYHATAIEKAIDSMVWTKISVLEGAEPAYVPIINANPHHLGREFSIRLRQLAEQSPPAYTALSWYEDQGIVRVSVRTNGVPDAGKVADYIGNKDLGHGLGGGGHPNSAAAQFTIEQFNKRLARMTQKDVMAQYCKSSSCVENPRAEPLCCVQVTPLKQKGIV